MSHADWFIDSLQPYITKIKAMGGVVTARDVRRHIWTFRHGGECLLESLVQHGRGQWVACPPGPKGGRPTRVFVLIDETSAAEAAEDAV